MGMIPLDTDDLIKLGLAVIIGGLIGVEREVRDKAAGFRTIICICVGATLFTILSIKLPGGGQFDPSRIAAGVVVGVGFLGAGAILRDSQRVIGLTTAATIWLVAALGLAIGAGAYWLSILASVLVIVVLTVFPMFGKIIDRRHVRRSYTIRCRPGADACERIRDAAEELGLQTRVFKRMREGEVMHCILDMNGSREAHDSLVNVVIEDSEVETVEY